MPNTAYAAQITARSLTLEPNAAAVAAGKPSSSAYSITGHADTTGQADHHFKFTITTTSGIRSIGFDYCTTASGTCTAPTDLTAASATLGATVGLAGSPTIHAATSSPYVSFTADPTATAVEVTLAAVYNPSAINTSFYVRITTYTSSNITTGATDTGVVTASTARPIILTGQMPEYLQFCAAVSVGTTGGNNAPDCTTATSGAVAFNQLFDPTSTASATSQMAAASNAGSGFVITYYGDTLKSGGNSITAIGTTATTSNIGASQFGLNTVANTTPSVGSNVSVPTVPGNVYHGRSVAPYSTANSYAFNANSLATTTVADSNGQVTDAQIYTVSYIVNVRASQAAGTYTTTLTYVCTPTY